MQSFNNNSYKMNNKSSDKDLSPTKSNIVKELSEFQNFNIYRMLEFNLKNQMAHLTKVN